MVSLRDHFLTSPLAFKLLLHVTCDGSNAHEHKLCFSKTRSTYGDYQLNQVQASAIRQGDKKQNQNQFYKLKQEVKSTLTTLKLNKVTKYKSITEA